MLTERGPGALAGAAEAGQGIAERRPDTATICLRLRQWRPLRRSTLRGFASITVFPIGLDIDNVAVHARDGRCWASLPVRPTLDRDGRALRDAGGRVRYERPIRWATRRLTDRFSERLIEVICRMHPGDLDDDSDQQ